MTMHGAWCTTRSRNGAAETMRGFGSRTRNLHVAARAPGTGQQLAFEPQNLALQAGEERGPRPAS